MRERFWTVQCSAGGEGESTPRQCPTLTTEHLLDSIELLITEYDREEEIHLVIRTEPAGTRVYVVDGPGGSYAVTERPPRGVDDSDDDTSPRLSESPKESVRPE